MTLDLLSSTSRPTPRQASRRPARLRRTRSTRVDQPSRRQRPDLSIVIPVFNEAESLAALYEETVAALPGRRYELIFVDDGSRDGSFDVLRSLHRIDQRVKVVRLRRNFGKTAALSAGFRQAAGDIVITLDADLQDDPAEIPRLLDRLNDGYDLVTGWRWQRRDRLRKRIASWCFNWAAGWLAGLPLHDVNCGLKAFRRTVADDLDLYGEMHRFLPILAHGKGYRVAEVRVRHRQRRYGLSKYGTTRFVSGLLDLLKVVFLTRYATRPLRLFGGAGFGLFSIGLALGIYLTILRLAGETIGNRPLLWLAVLLITAGLQVISIGLIGELVRHLAHEPGQEYAIAERLG